MRMTEVEWWGGADPSEMIRWLRRLMNPRKFRLFVCACCRSRWNELTPEPARRAIDVLERYADGRAGEQELDDARAIAGREANKLCSLLDGMSGGWRDTLQPQTHLLLGAVRSAFRIHVDLQPWPWFTHVPRD